MSSGALGVYGAVYSRVALTPTPLPRSGRGADDDNQASGVGGEGVGTRSPPANAGLKGRRPKGP